MGKPRGRRHIISRHTTAQTPRSYPIHRGARFAINCHGPCIIYTNPTIPLLAFIIFTSRSAAFVSFLGFYHRLHIQLVGKYRHTGD